MHSLVGVRGSWALIILCACGHSPPPRATCGGGFATLSQVSSTESADLDPLRSGISRLPFSWITAVRVTGVEPALARTLEHGLATEIGMMVSDAPLRDDVRRLFKSGVIADAHVELVGDNEVEFVVTPRARIQRVVVHGGDPEMARRFRLLEGAAYEPARIQRMADAAQLAYVRGGRPDAVVEARRVVTGDRVAVCIAANPGPKVTIGALTFPGASAISPPKLVAAMRSSEKINRVGGVFDPGALETDKIFIQAEYWERGHANVKIGEPRTVRRGGRLLLEVPIDEGPVFRFGRISTSHRIDTPIALAPGDMFSRTRVVKVLETLRRSPEIEDVTPRTKIDLEARTIDITFDITWRWPWFVLSHLPPLS